LVLAPLAVGVAYLGGWVFAAFWTSAAMLAFREWTILVTRDDRLLLIAIGTLSIVVAVTIAAWKPSSGNSAFWLVLLLAVIAAGMIGTMVSMHDGRGIWAAAGIPYAGTLAIAPVILRSDPRYGFQAIIFVFAVVWTTDIVAFFVGRTVQGPKLAPAISPNKTWSGALGGGFAAMGVAALIGSFFTVSGLKSTVIVALVLSVASQVGDLLESALKRRFGAKDSGRLIPGHGGLLDRLDAFVAAVLIAAFIGIGRGGLEAPAGGLLAW